MAQKRRRNKKSKKIISLVLFLVLFVVACTVVYFVWNEYFKGDKKEDEEAVVIDDVDKKDEKEKEDKKDDKEEKTEQKVEKEEIKPYEGNNPNTAEELTGVITYAEVSGSSLIIRINIDQYLDSGNCTLNLMSGGASIYSDTANIVSSASTATCEGFNVPLSSIGSGNYQIIIKLNSGSKTGTIQGEVNI